MKKCENCGYENEDNASKCSRCNYLFIEYNKEKAVEDNKIQDNTILFENQSSGNNVSSYTDKNGYYEIDISNNPIFNNQNDDNLFNINNSLESNQASFSNSNKSKTKAKNPIVGLVLSFIVSGLGNIYAGLYRRGIFQIIISVMLNYLTMYVYPNNMLVTAINFLWAFYVMMDSYLCIVALNEGKEIPLLFGFIRFKE